MHKLTALLLLTAGCHIDVTGNGHTERTRPSDDLNMRTPANDMGCYPDTLSREQALCLCEDLDEVGELRLLEGDAPASLGVNGKATLVGDVHIEGSLHAQAGVHAVTATAIRDHLSTAGSFTWVGDQHIQGDLNVGRHLDGVGHLSVDGVLRLGGKSFVVGDVDASRHESYEALDDPCACDGDTYFNVAIAVADAAQVNDNLAIGLQTTLGNVGATDITLPSGRYYLDSWSAVGATRIVADGHVALFVDGSITNVGASQITIAEGATLDLYVAGSVQNVGAVNMGVVERPNAFRLFIGGADAVLVGVGAQHIAGNIYAPRAAIELVGKTEIHGALFARTLDGVGDLTIVYAGGAPTADETFEEIPPEEPR